MGPASARTFIGPLLRLSIGVEGFSVAELLSFSGDHGSDAISLFSSERNKGT